MLIMLQPFLLQTGCMYCLTGCKKLIFAYHGGHKFESQEEDAAHIIEWKAWSAGLGDTVVDPGMPGRRAVKNCAHQRRNR